MSEQGLVSAPQQVEDARVMAFALAIGRGYTVGQAVRLVKWLVAA